MNLGSLIAQFRADVDDAVEPYLWSEASVLNWMNEAEQEACRRADLLIDSTTVAITQLTTVADNAWITISPKIVAIRRARPRGQEHVAVITATEMDGRSRWEDETGTVLRALIRDMATDKLRTYPVLTASIIIDLTVRRLPLEDMDDLENDSPEIRAEYHLKLLDWVKFRAYSVDDVDANDPQKAMKHMNAFIHEFGATSANMETFQRAHASRDMLTGYFA